MSQHQHPKESTSWYPKSVIAGDISSLKPSTLGTTTPATAAVSSSSSLEVPSEERMFYASLFSHGLAALTAKLVSAPADRARILLQTSTVSTQRLFPSIRSVLRSAQGHHYTAVHIHLLHMAGTTWIRHYLYHCHLRPVLDSNTKGQGLASTILSGAAAMIVMYPLDVLYTRRLVMAMPSRLPITRARDLYRGLGVSLLAAPVYSAVAMMAYGYCKDRIRDPVIAGGVAGGIAGIATYPVETIRRRMMAGLPWGGLNMTLYRGLGVFILKTVPEIVVLSAAYKYIVNLPSNSSGMDDTM